MRIRTNATAEQVRAAARTAGVDFDRFEVKGARSHAHGYDVLLTGSSGRRANGGWSGATLGGYAATWDEWGVFLAEIFKVDSTTDCGGYYVGIDDFREQTGGRYDGPFKPCPNHKWVWNRGESECAKGCGAVRRPMRRVG